MSLSTLALQIAVLGIGGRLPPTPLRTGACMGGSPLSALLEGVCELPAEPSTPSVRAVGCRDVTPTLFRAYHLWIHDQSTLRFGQEGYNNTKEAEAFIEPGFVALWGLIWDCLSFPLLRRCCDLTL
ncbi:hypothetical protein BJY00DRAFT_230568 [Aspergillus carlsbadensis]|nr:hypothetical protein BJY00DRAFT_230568 [Aspergillus carlsbadensis]